MTYKKQIGNLGEDIATNYLKEKDYKIIARNEKISYQEIDIIASIKGITVFVEVKTSTFFDDYSAEMAMNKTKLKNFKKAISMYSSIHKLDIDMCRFDLIAVYINKANNLPNIKHYIEIF